MSRKEGCGAEENVRIVQRILKCEISISAASREMGVGWETIHRWMARYEAEREAGLLRIVRQGGERGFHGHSPAEHGKGVLAAAQEQVQRGDLAFIATIGWYAEQSEQCPAIIADLQAIGFQMNLTVLEGAAFGRKGVFCR